MVKTPAGNHLGIVERLWDGGWDISPHERGLSKVTDTSEKLSDAKHYLVNRLTRPVEVTKNAQIKRLRIISDRSFFLRSVTSAKRSSTKDSRPMDFYELEFWDEHHGLKRGDSITLKHLQADYPGFSDVLEGEVHSIQAHEVTIKGSSYPVPDGKA